MKIKDVIAYVDAIKPNAFPDEVKVQWINEVEGFIQTDVMLLDILDVIQYRSPDDHDTELLVKPPHAKIYYAYLTAMVDFANGEYNKYSNTMMMYNEFISEYMIWYADHYRPADGMAVAHGYYISAYGIAVAHGYTGTEEQWIADLKGEKGEPFRYEDFTEEQLKALTGPMPVKGVDYWNAEDMAEIKRDTEEMIADQLNEAVKEVSEVGGAYAESAAQSAERAEQAAVANGYMEFELSNEDGILYLVRTDNIVDDVDFELDENTGELEVIIK